jgi:hypothetical protein
MNVIDIKSRSFICPILGEINTDYTFCCAKCKYNIFDTPIDNKIYCEYENNKNNKRDIW